jgi:ethanolaminephosphotransferase
MMAHKTLLLTLANFLLPIAILVFATGFFPYKPFMPGLAKYEQLGWEDRMGWGKGSGVESVPDAPFERLVFMVVDALRSDFVYGEESGMAFVQRWVFQLHMMERATIEPEGRLLTIPPV